MRARLACIAVVAAVAMSACGGDDNGESAQSADFGKAGEQAQADRTIEVHLLDTLRFDPSSINVKAGETITFKVVNDGKQLHEFVLGDQRFQDEHEKEMAEMEGHDMKMADQPNYVDLDAGETKELTWTFPSEETRVLYGCHVPGHYKAGMRGTVSVS